MQARSPAAKEETMLELKKICKNFKKGTVNEKVAINNHSLTLEDGDFVTLIG